MIREATFLDAADISRLHCSCFEKGWKEKDIEELFEGGGIHAWLSEKDGIAVAFLLVRTSADESEIIAVAVDRAFRKQAIALNLMAHFHKFAKQQGWKKLFLEVAEDNFDARHLYERLEYNVFNRRKGYYQRWHGRKIDALMMEKNL